MINYDWNCKTVDCLTEKDGNQNVAYNVHWIVTGTSDEINEKGVKFTSRSIGTQSLNTDDIEDFTSFKNLLNEDVVKWVKSAMGEEEILKIEESISKRIDSLITPASVTLKISEPELEEIVEEQKPAKEKVKASKTK